MKKNALLTLAIVAMYFSSHAQNTFPWSATGNVGINSPTAPISPLQVNDNSTKLAIGDASGVGLAYGTSYVGFNAARSGNNWTINQDGANNGGAVIFGSIFGDLYFANVGTTGPIDKVLTDNEIRSKVQFHIAPDGTTNARAIKVQTTQWPDYVFKPNYVLTPLPEVKKYVDQHQHLSGLPSEKEIEEKGLDLGEMNKLLTKKVEELTLYMIEKDVEEKKQKQVNDELKAKVENLNSQLQLIKDKLHLN